MWRARNSIAPIYILKQKLRQKTEILQLSLTLTESWHHRATNVAPQSKQRSVLAQRQMGISTCFPEQIQQKIIKRIQLEELKKRKTEGNKTQVGQECEAQVVKNILQFFSSKVPLHTQGSPGEVLRKHGSWLGLGEGERSLCSRAQDPTCIFLLCFLCRTKILTGVGRWFLVTLRHW